MNRWKTFKAFLSCLFRGGRCRFISAASGDRCRLPKGHEGGHVMWWFRWL
jgi:hypothetical protein